MSWFNPETAGLSGMQVCIMGNHYGGQYDPVWEVDAMLQRLLALFILLLTSCINTFTIIVVIVTIIIK